jgi:PTH1 family peptidyl-tRNA hydrolase
VGADVVLLLAARHGGALAFSKRDKALTDDVRIQGDRVALAFPQTYMNDSGVAVRLLLKRHDLFDRPERLVVVHDELDLPPGTVRVKEGGGLAGHNGLRSIKDHLRTDVFLRVRIGIGKPPGGKEQGANHVLKRPSKRDREELAVAVEEAADAVELILADGVGRAMNRYNSSPSR